jgi:hypothetical protein
LEERRPEPAPADDRLALRKAHAERRAAEEELAEREAAIASARSFAAAVENDAKMVAEIAAASARRSAEAISRGEAPTDDSDTTAKTAAVIEQRRQHFKETIRLLALQRDAAQAALDRAKRKVNEAIEGITKALAVAESDEQKRHETAVWRSQDLLTCISELRVARPSGLPLNPNDPFAAERANVLVSIALPADVIQRIQRISALDHRWRDNTLKAHYAARLSAWQKAMADGDCDAEL